MALAPHTVRVASEALNLMNLPRPVPVRLFVPVFPIRDLSGGCRASDNCTTAQPQQRTFLLQGLFQSQRCSTQIGVSWLRTTAHLDSEQNSSESFIDSGLRRDYQTGHAHCCGWLAAPPGGRACLACRRDYSGLFDAVAKSKELTSTPNFSLRLIGKGDLQIPASLRGRVTKETNLAYKVGSSVHLT